MIQPLFANLKQKSFLHIKVFFEYLFYFKSAADTADCDINMASLTLFIIQCHTVRWVASETPHCRYIYIITQKIILLSAVFLWKSLRITFSLYIRSLGLQYQLYHKWHLIYWKIANSEHNWFVFITECHTVNTDSQGERCDKTKADFFFEMVSFCGIFFFHLGTFKKSYLITLCLAFLPTLYPYLRSIQTSRFPL